MTYVKTLPVSAREWSLQQIAVHMALSCNNSALMFDEKPRVGDLVFLLSAPANMQWLSWVLDLRTDPRLGEVYGLQSIGLDEVVNWTNVHAIVVDREWVAKMPRLRWHDDHWRFYKRFTAEERRAGLYISRPYIPEIMADDGSVEFYQRYSYNRDEPTVTMPLPDWRNMSRAEMRCIIAQGVARLEAAYRPYNEARRIAREAEKVT